MTEAEAQLKREAVQDVIRILRVRGMEKEEAERITVKHRDRIETVPKAGGPELRIRLKSGTAINRRELRRFVAELEDESTLDSFGVRPEEVLAERLVIGGYDSEEAQRLAARHARRELDGRVRITYPGRDQPEFSDPEEGSPTHDMKILNALADTLVRDLETRPAREPAGGHGETVDYAVI